MANLSSPAMLSLSVFVISSLPGFAQAGAELGALRGLGTGLGAGTAIGLKHTQKKTISKFESISNQANSKTESISKQSNAYLSAAQKLEKNKQYLKSAKYYAAFASTRSRMPNGQDALTLRNFDKAASLADKAGDGKLAQEYKREAYKVCVRLNGKQSPETSKRLKELNGLKVSKAKTTPVTPAKSP